MELRQLQTFIQIAQMQSFFQNGRDAGVFAVGSDGSDPPAGKRTWEKAVRQDRKESGAYPAGGRISGACQPDPL